MKTEPIIHLIVAAGFLVVAPLAASAEDETNEVSISDTATSSVALPPSEFPDDAPATSTPEDTPSDDVVVGTAVLMDAEPAPAEIRAVRFNRTLQTESVLASSTPTATSTPREVRDEKDLNLFVADKFRDDSRLTNAEVSSTTVSAEYAMPAKLFGLIPTSLSATVTTDATGAVTVSYPWYGFLFDKPGEELRSEVTEAVRVDIASSTAHNASSTVPALPVETRASVFGQMTSVFNRLFGDN